MPDIRESTESWRFHEMGWKGRSKDYPMSKISMPVECIGEVCRNCSKLEIDIARIIINGVALNRLECTHREQCELIQSMVKKEMAIQTTHEKHGV